MAHRQDPPTIPLDQLDWLQTGEDHDPGARLLAHIRIGDLDMHLEAWAVEGGEDTRQFAVDSSMRSDAFDSLSEMMECSFTTAEIEGRDYFLIATPYGL